MNFEAIRAAALIMEPQIIIMVTGVVVAARWRRISSGPLPLEALGFAFILVFALVSQSAELLTAALVTQEVAVIYWIAMLISEIRSQDKWEARIEEARNLMGCRDDQIIYLGGGE